MAIQSSANPGKTISKTFANLCHRNILTASRRTRKTTFISGRTKFSNSSATVIPVVCATEQRPLPCHAGGRGFRFARHRDTIEERLSHITPEGRQALHEAWLRRRADRVKPAADVDLGMSLTAIMPGSRRVGCLRVPPVDSKIGISTSNHEPVDGVGGNESTDFTSKLLKRCHGCHSRISVLCHLHSAIRPVADLVSKSSVRRLVPSSRNHAGEQRDPSSKPQE
jgi:hypothetical protein